MKKILYLSLGTIIFIAGFCCFSKLKKCKDTLVPLSSARPIPTVTARLFNKTETLVFPGKVRASRRVKLAFSVSGLITEINALEGQNVKEGEVLARLDPRDFQNAFQAGKAKYAEARQAFRRIQSLRMKNVVCASEYERAQAEYNIAQAELQVRKKALQDTVLYAPFDGVVADRYVENHEHIRDKEPVLSFQDISVIEVVIQVPERIIRCGGAENLKKIQVCFEADKKCCFTASLRESCICSDSMTGAFDAVVVLKELPEMKILPGMTAAVQVEISGTPDNGKRSASGVLLPVEAVFSEADGKSYAWIIKAEGGKAEKRRIETGSLHNDGIEVISGIKSGENVAVSAIHSLREDIDARPMTPGKDGLEG